MLPPKLITALATANKRTYATCKYEIPKHNYNYHIYSPPQYHSHHFHTSHYHFKHTTNLLHHSHTHSTQPQALHTQQMFHTLAVGEHHCISADQIAVQAFPFSARCFTQPASMNHEAASTSYVPDCFALQERTRETSIFVRVEPRCSDSC